MATLILLWLGLGLAPLVLGFGRSTPGTHDRPRPPAGSMLIAALAFNLVYFWQELWLAVPKAFVPGLSVTLYHNDHEWIGHAPVAELLQGGGAVATLTLGLAALTVLASSLRLSPTWRVLAFWTAFEGLFQSLSQLAIGSRLPGNDVGRALTYIGIGQVGRAALLSVAAVGMMAAGTALGRVEVTSLAVNARTGTRPFAVAMILSAVGTVLLTIGFRVPNDVVEVALVPTFIVTVGIGWVVLGGTLAPRSSDSPAECKIGIAGPALGLLATLAFFQLVLRPGVAL